MTPSLTQYARSCGYAPQRVGWRSVRNIFMTLWTVYRRPKRIVKEEEEGKKRGKRRKAVICG